MEGSDWDNIQTVQESDNLYLYKLTKSGRPIWVAWNDSSAAQQISISGVDSSHVKVTTAVPRYQSGVDVTDYGTAFEIDTLAVVNGSVSLQLAESPVFVEEFTIVSVGEEFNSTPSGVLFYQNYPNPFNSQAQFTYELPGASRVSLKIYNVLGQEVRTLVSKNQPAGHYSVLWDGKNDRGVRVSSGVYFYQLRVGDEFSKTKKLLLLR